MQKGFEMVDHEFQKIRSPGIALSVENDFVTSVKAICYCGRESFGLRLLGVDP